MLNKYFTSEYRLKLIFNGILLIHFLDLLLFCVNFLFVYSDSDQTILWLASTDMGNGLFYEPAFYGQAYNTMVEALLAVPFIKLNLFIPYALAVSSVIFSYSVIWIFSRYYFKRQNYFLAILCLALPIILPTEFQIMITISRGFIPGISFTLFGVYMLLTYQGRLKLILAGFFLAMGFIFNPNSSVILSAFSVYYLLKPNPNIWHEIKYLVLGGLPAVAYKVYVVWFYSSYPNYNLHIFPNAFEFSLGNWVNTVNEIYYLFMGLFPVVNNVGCLSILLLLIFVLFWA